MIKKADILALALCLLLVLSSPGSVQAQSRLAILNNTTKVEFPSKLIFNLSVKSDVNVTDIRLRYVVDRVSFAKVTSEVFIEFEPATTVNAKWTLHMRKIGGLPPGSGVVYWWTVEDASGDVVETNPVRVHFDDNRYSWHSLTEGEVTIYWYKGKQSFAQELMAAAQQELVRLAEDTGTELDKTVKIYVYASADDLRVATICHHEWTGGIAFPRYGIITIGIAPDRLDWGKRAIAHELSHLVIQKLALNPYINLPVWLDEGLAMHAEGRLEPPYIYRLYQAVVGQTLISVRSLSSPFSAYFDEASLAYAQSYSIVEFLINSYGRSKILELLHTFKQGTSYDDALEKVYGFDIAGLDTLWRDYWRRQSYSPKPSPEWIYDVTPAKPYEKWGK